MSRNTTLATYKKITFAEEYLLEWKSASSGLWDEKSTLRSNGGILAKSSMYVCMCTHGQYVSHTWAHRAQGTGVSEVKWWVTFNTDIYYMCITVWTRFLFCIGNNRQILGRWWVVAAAGQPHHLWCSPASLHLLILLWPLPWFPAPQQTSPSSRVWLHAPSPTPLSAPQWLLLYQFSSSFSEMLLSV